MKKFLEINTHRGEVLYTERLSRVLEAVRESYGTYYLRPTKEGVSVFVDNWKV